MRRKLLSLVLCLVMVLSLFPSFVVPAIATKDSDVAVDDSYTQSFAGTPVSETRESNTTFNNRTVTCTIPITYHLSIVVVDGVIVSVDVSKSNGTATYNPTKTGGNWDTARSNAYSAANSSTENALNNLQNAINRIINDSSVPATEEGVTGAFRGATGTDVQNAASQIKSAIHNAPKVQEPDPEQNEEWIYTPVTMPEGGWKTDSTYPDEKLYAYVDGEYVPVVLNHSDIYRQLDKTSWTAQEANSWVTSHNNQNLFYKNNNKFEIVYARKETWYQNAGNSVNIYDAFGLDGIHLFNFTDCNSDYYVFTNLNNTNEPVWHKVYSYQVGDMGGGGGYWVTLYYYPAEYNRYYPNAQNANSRSRERSAIQWNKTDFLNDGRSILANNNEWQAYGWRIPVGGDSTYRNLKANYTDGNLYVSKGTSSKYNELFTNSIVLAWPKPGSDESMIYEGPLYSAEQGVTKITYGNGTVLTEESNIAGDVLYNGPLFTRSIGVRGDLVGYKSLSDRQNDGSYNLTIDSWATGQVQGYETSQGTPGTPASTTVTETVVQKKVPLDVALVIDQSGSMGTADMGEEITGHEVVSPANGSTWTEKEINNGTVYYCKVGDKYYPVKTETGNVYTEASSVRGNKMFGYGHDGISLGVNGSPVHFNVPTNYYIKYNGEMHKLYMITVGKDLEYGLYPYIYTDDNSTYAKKTEWKDNIYWVALFSPWGAYKLRNNDNWKNAVSGIRWVNSNGETLEPTDSNGDSVKTEYRRVLGIGLTDAYYIKNLYTVSDSGTTGLYYVDDNGQKVSISNTRVMGEDEFELDTSVCDGKLYVAVSDSTRIQALRKAVETFSEALAQNAKENDVEHRLAIVGFAGNMFPGQSTGKTAVQDKSTKLEYTDTGVFLNGSFINYGSLNQSTPYSKVEGATSTNDLYLNKHYYVKSGDDYRPIAYDYSTARWYYTDTNAWLTSRNGTYRGTFYTSNLDEISEQQYRNALVPVLDEHDNQKYDYNNHSLVSTGNDVNDDLDKAIDNFGYYGGTYTSYGMAMANNILSQNPVRKGTEVTTTTVKTDGEVVDTYDKINPDVDGERIIVVFTDGEPGARGYDANIANEALAGGVQSKMTTEDGGLNAKVYSVGLYPQGASNQVESFMHQLSSEYTASIVEIDAGSDYATQTALNGNSTYYYKESDGKYYAVTAKINGKSTLGWWEHNAADSSYSQLVIEGKNGSGEHPIYSDKHHQNQVFGEDAKTNQTYYSYDGDPVRYEYRWYDADRHIREPKLGNGTSLPEGAFNHNRYQFYEITGQTANSDGESYYTLVKTGDQLVAAFNSIVNSIKTSTETTVVPGEPGTPAGATNPVSYGGNDTIIRDVINAAFELDPNAEIEIQLIESDGLEQEPTNGGIGENQQIYRPVAGNVLASTTANTLTYQDETIQLTKNDRTIDVTGFEFSDHYITDNHNGAFLRVIIHNLQPNGTGKLYSNTNAAAIYSKKTDGTPGDKFFSYNNPSVNVEDYTVTWINGEETLETDFNVPFNGVPDYEGSTPERAIRSEERDGKVYKTVYTFAGWSQDADASAEDVVSLENERITENTTYYAIFTEATTETRTSFTVIWNNDSVLETDPSVAAGTVPEYNGSEPKYNGSEPENNDMVFVGWTTDPDDTTLTMDRIQNDEYPENFSTSPNLPVEYYPSDDDGVVNFYAVFMAKGNLEERTKKVVVEYSTKNKIDSSVYELEVVAANGGTFAKEKKGDVSIGEDRVEFGDLFFKPAMKADGDSAYDMSPMSSVSTAKYYTGASAREWSKNKTLTTVTVIPGTSVYYDDDIKTIETTTIETTPVETSEKEKTFNYEAQLNKVDVNNAAEPIQGGKQLTFTFTGTGIEVYAHTSTNSGKVGAYLYNSEGKIIKSQIMNNNSEDINLYNVPTIRFDVEYGTYKLLIIPNNNADYRLDGIRVFNPGTEKTAQYLNIRKELLSQYAESQEIFGALYLVANKRVPAVANYTKLGPKNEVYLDKDEFVAFEIKGITGGTYRVGLSAVSGDEVKAVVSNGEEDPILYHVNGKTHVFYTVVPSNGQVVITNNSDDSGAILSITDLEIVGGTPKTITDPSDNTENVQGPVLMASRRLMSYARSFDADSAQPLPGIEGSEPDPQDPDDPDPQDPDDPDPQDPDDPDPQDPDDPDPQDPDDPDPQDPDDPGEPTVEPGDTPTTTPTIFSVVKQIVSNFVSNIVKGFARLFGR